jgi:hypothetical protein
MIDHEETTTSVRCSGQVGDFDEALTWAVGKIDLHRLDTATVHLSIKPVSIMEIGGDEWVERFDVCVWGDPT